MAIVKRVVLSNSDGTLEVSFTEDDVAHQWTAIHVSNQGTQPITVTGDINGSPFSFVVQPGFSADRPITINLVQTTNFKNQVVWIPPFEYSIGVV